MTAHNHAIESLRSRDFSELMAMMTASFQTVAPELPRLDVLLPDLYRPTDEAMKNLWGVRREGRIIGCLGLFPVPVPIFGCRTAVAGIGGVCTLPECRGQGVMEALMDHAILEMVRQGYALAILGGDRKRYRPWGFEVVMGRYCFTLDARGPEFVKYDVPFPGPIRRDDPDWDVLYHQACTNPALTLCTREMWQLKYQRAGHHLYWLDDPQGAHVLVYESGPVCELRAWAGPPERVGQLTAAVIGRYQKPLQVHLSPFPDPYLPVFRDLMTDGHLARSGNLAVVDLVKTLRLFQAYLSSRVRQLGLRGQIGIHLDSLGGLPAQDLALKADGRDLLISDEPVPSALVLDLWELVDLMFNPPGLCTLKLQKNNADWIAALFPLPFHLPAIFHV